MQPSLLAVLDALPINAALLDHRGTILQANAAWTRFAIANDESPSIDWKAFNYLDLCRRVEGPDSVWAGKAVAALEAVLAGTVDSAAFDYPCPAPHKERWYRFVAAPLPFEDAPSGAIVLHIDISEAKAAEKLAIASLDEIIRANEAKSSFLASVSHELRTPLNAIIGFTEMMQLQVFGPLGNEKYASYVDYISTSANLLLNVVNGLLDLARIEAGRHDLRSETLDPRSLVCATVNSLRSMASARNLELVTLFEDVPDGFQGDGNAIRQILVNLLGNAIKFTPDGGTVTCRVGVAGPWIVFRVEDSGPGMTAAEIEVAREPFGQVRGRAPLNGNKGSGLGLPIAIKLAELHGGDLTISSRPGHGTVVTVRIPRTP